MTKPWLIGLIEADQCGEALIALELTDFLVEVVDFGIDVVFDLITLFATVDTLLTVFLSDLGDELLLELLEIMIDYLIDLLFALEQLLPDILW